ncbi:MAG: TonB-dependent receptor [Gammaproteobacteria bacterium]|nr:TonB-dependent receptor [Gammaproteobacteria bacterium]
MTDHQRKIPETSFPVPATLLAIAISNAMSLPVYAQNADGEAETLEEVQVWGTEVKASSIKLEDDTMAIKQADHVSDLLRTIPGVDVGGAHSLNQRITIRSMDDKDLQITIDGASQNSYMYHHMGNLQIHADILQAVEIDIGTNSVLNGGLGGSVRFETKSASQLLRDGKRFGGRVQAAYGDNSGTSVALTGFGKLSDSLDVLGYYNAVDRDNYEVGGGKIKDFSGNEIDGTDGTVRGLEGELTDGLLKFGWDIDESQRLELGVESYKDEGDYSYRPDMGLATDLAITNNLGIPLLWPTEFTRDTLTLNYDLDWGGHSYLKTAVYGNTSKLKRDESGWADNEAFADSAGKIKGEAQNTGLNMLGETSAGRNTLTYGLELNKYDTEYQARYDTGNTDKSNESSEIVAVYVQDQYAINDNIAVTPGIRFNQADVDATLVKDTFSEVTGALALEYTPTSKLLLSLSTTQLFKAPEIGEVFTGGGLFDTPNPDIQAETGLNSELSLAYEDAMLGAERFATGVTVFQTTLDDYIYDYAPNDEGSWKDNVGDMEITGFEAYIAYDKGALKALLTYSKADSELDAFAQYTALDGARLDRTQGDTLSLNLDYRLSSTDLSLHWESLLVDDVKADLDLDGATADNAKDGYSVHNVSAKWSPKSIKGLGVTVGIDNIFDEFYASQSSRTGLSLHPRFGELYLQDYEPGRNIKLTVSYDL